MQTNKVVAVAIVGYDGVVYSLPAPNRHHNVIRMMVLELEHPRPIDGKQGFLDVYGKFLTRKEAYVVALEADQMLPQSRTCALKELFSEDVW